jgi:hypothetical protein
VCAALVAARQAAAAALAGARPVEVEVVELPETLLNPLLLQRASSAAMVRR